MEWLALDGNNITNISPLKNLPKLKYVDITGCPIEDYSPVEFVDEVNR
ncbi:MAG: leucine-rich repeat domain-containing protein [Eisenbergiella massiliensis]